jgi:hypothetical protein
VFCERASTFSRAAERVDDRHSLLPQASAQLSGAPRKTVVRLNWFYPALMVLVGAHYLPFTFLYGMRMFVPLSVVLIGGGVVIALYFSFSPGWGDASVQSEKKTA